MLRIALAALAAGLTLAGSAAAATTAPTAAPLRQAHVGAATLGYRVLNPGARGTPLLLICGFGQTAAAWDPAFVERLARGRRVIVFDNRGVGNSTGPVAHLTIRRMARDAAGLLHALHIGRADVLGWSMGGYIAQELALDRPGLVHRLVLASTDPGSPHAIEPAPRVVRILTNPDLSPQDLLPILFPANRQAAGQAWLKRVGRQPDLGAADFATPAAALAEQQLANANRWYGRGDGTYARLPRLRAPTFVGFGRRDVVVPPGNAKLLRARIPDVRVRGYADAGHAFLFEHPVAHAAVFARFLDG